MIVITMTDCPVGLRGDLTKWLLEISPGVFVGQVSARVRDNLWERIKETVKNGKVTMVFSTNNEQHLDFRVHNSLWEPIDFDGIKLILRPSPSRIKALGELRMGFSNASKRQKAKHFSAKKRSSRFPENYVVIDIETSGLDPEKDEIIEIGAVKVKDQEVIDKFNFLIKPQKPISSKIEGFTNITNDMLQTNGVDISVAMKLFISFIENLPLVAHNIEFDYSFLRKACSECGLNLISNQSIDTLAIARRKLKNVSNYKLETLANFFEIEVSSMHRSLSDCELTYQVYEKLINFDKD